MRAALRHSLTLAAMTLMLCPAAMANVPTHINVQGRLADSAGIPAPVAAYQFTFRLYDAEASGTQVWPANGVNGEQQIIVPDDNGLWEAAVGADSALSGTVLKDTTHWLEVTVWNFIDPAETLPRVKLGSSPFSLQASDADNLGGQPPSAFAVASHTHSTGDLAPQGSGSGFDADLLDGQHGSFYRSAANINAGTLSATRFSAYNDLTSEGYLDDNSDDDLLLRSQLDGRFLSAAGDTMTGVLDFGSPSQSGAFRLFGNGISSPVLQATNFSSHGGSIRMYDELGALNLQMEADGTGEGTYFKVFGDASGSSYFLASNTGGGNMEVEIVGTNSSLFRTGSPGNSSVELPTGSISDAEIMDEPGLASNNLVGQVFLAQGTGVMEDVVTVAISTPTSGYILVQAKGDVILSGTTGANRVHVQIDETAGGTFTAPYYVAAGGSDVNGLRFPCSLHRVYFKLFSGTYTFRLEARAATSNSSGASSSINVPMITALYIPTAYGAVSTVVSQGEAGEFAEARPERVVTTSDDGTESSKTMYRVDLRELEVRAARAEAAAEKAKRELLEAQESAQAQQANSADLSPQGDQ